MTDELVTPAEFPEPTAKPAAEATGGCGGGGGPDALSESYKMVLEQKQFVTGRISETVRYVGFGLLAVFYAVISSDAAFAHAILASMSPMLTAMAIFGVIAVLFDYLQYLAGSVAVNRAIAGGSEADYRYDKTWRSYRWRQRCFWIKQAAVIVGCVLLLIILLVANISPHACVGSTPANTTTAAAT